MKKAAGTQNKFVTLLAPIKADLYKIAYCYVKNETNALEIISNTVYNAYLAFPKLRNQKYFKTWITRIVINESIAYLRHSVKTIPLYESHLNTAHETQVSSAERLDLYDALELLSPEERGIIILKYFQDMTFREISGITKIPENTIKTRHYRILKKLKGYLSDLEVSFS